MNCPECSSENTTKAIAMAMPMRLCIDCGNIWGLWSYLYVIFAWLEAMISGGHCLMMGYDGTYWEALEAWLKGPEDDE